MCATIIFNTDRQLKAAAQKKLRKQGLTLTALLNFATRAYVNDEITVDIIARDLAEARQGETIPEAEVYRRFGLRR